MNKRVVVVEIEKKKTVNGHGKNRAHKNFIVGSPKKNSL